MALTSECPGRGRGLGGVSAPYTRGLRRCWASVLVPWHFSLLFFTSRFCPKKVKTEEGDVTLFESG